MDFLGVARPVRSWMRFASILSVPIAPLPGIGVAWLMIRPRAVKMRWPPKMFTFGASLTIHPASRPSISIVLVSAWIVPVFLMLGNFETPAPPDLVDRASLDDDTTGHAAVAADLERASVRQGRAEAFD